MHIGILTEYYPPEMGAPQARLSELAGHFVSRGHKVSVLTAMPNYPTGRSFSGYGGLYRKEWLGGAEILRCPIYATKNPRMLPRMANYLSFTASSAAIGSFKLPRVDYLLTESPPLFLGMSGWWLSVLKQARWIFNVSDLWPESAVRLNAVREGVSLKMAWWLEQFCYEHAWLVSGQSREILANIERRFPHVPTWHLSNGVNTERFHPGRRSDAMRERLLGGYQRVVVYAGLHGIAQGLEQVLEAAVLLAREGKNGFRIVLVGDGPERERLIARKREAGLKNVEFWPPVPKDEMPCLMSSADVAVVPLRSRLPGAVPSKIYEAMACGVPVALAAEGEAADIVARCGAGEAVRSGDSAALATMLWRLISDEKRRKEIGMRGREAAVREFDRPKIATMFVDMLERELPTGRVA